MKSGHFEKLASNAVQEQRLHARFSPRGHVAWMCDARSRVGRIRWDPNRVAAASNVSEVSVTGQFINDEREWLEADGLGGFASGTVSGVRTRRYHGLLLMATTPPTGRMMLVNGFDAWVETAAGRQAISSQRYGPDVIHPEGAARIDTFTHEPWPT